MNKLSSNSMIESLINRLDEGGLWQTLSLDDEDIADILWLALQMGVVVEPTVQVETITETNTNTNTNIIDDGIIEPPSTFPKQDSVVNVYKESKGELVNQQTEQKTPKSGFPLQVPAAPTIQNSLEIGRSMRPLKRRFPSATRVILDEEATVNRIIEKNVWLPVTKPEPERWLDLELVIEESRSSFIWQELVDDFQQILENHGAFSSVRVWNIKFKPENQNHPLILTRHRTKGQIEQRQHFHRELIHPNQRGLTLLISDCVSPLWQNVTIYQWLKDWSHSQPTAIVQLFPERLWDSTQLGLGRKLFAKSLNPGVTNSKLILDDLPVWLPINWTQTLVLPVLNLEPQILKLWSRVVAGFGNSRISTYLFDLNFIEERSKAPKIDNEPVQEISSDEKAKIIVKHFLATASLTSQRLAGMMASVPVDISVVNLIRRTCLQEAQPVHVAEVYMSGLLYATQEDMEGKARVYDFLPGVRNVLNRAMAINETIGVLDAISKHIGESIKFSTSIRNFRAFVDLLPEILDKNHQEQILPFAQIAVDVLRNLGREYADLADKVSEHITTISPPIVGELEDSEPELKSCHFEVAVIKILKTQTFDFVVATLERQSKRRFFGLFGEQKSWVIKRQQKQAIGVVEELGEGVNLELMEIPEGKFIMGSPENELERLDRESPRHQVNVPKFYMGRYQITQEQWRIVAGWEAIARKLNPDPSRFKETYQGEERWTRPVEGVLWEEAKEFCARLSRKTKRKYRLPTEAEWEYACRAGTETPFHFGETITTDLANYNGNDLYDDGIKGKYRKQTTPVGYFGVANSFGLYDMHGNIWEWCEDDYHDHYKGAPEDGSAWFSGENQATKVRRGGSWFNPTSYCRSAYRNHFVHDFHYYHDGFRVVRVVSTTQ